MIRWFRRTITADGAISCGPWNAGDESDWINVILWVSCHHCHGIISGHQWVCAEPDRGGPLTIVIEFLIFSFWNPNSERSELFRKCLRRFNFVRVCPWTSIFVGCLESYRTPQGSNGNVSVHDTNLFIKFWWRFWRIFLRIEWPWFKISTMMAIGSISVTYPIILRSP